MKFITLLLLVIVLVSVSTRETHVKKSVKKHKKKGIVDSIKKGASAVANGAKNMYNKAKDAVTGFFNGDEEEAA